MVKVKAKKIPVSLDDPEEMLHKFIYHFPQYTLAQAQKLPYVRIKKMLTVARKEQALNLYNIAKIVFSQHTKEGKGMKKVLEELKNIIES